jgi:N utilization substance protein A
VPSEEVSLAIGRGGQNIRLASRITGYEIDVYRDIKEDEEDVEIDEFSDVMPADVIRRLKDIGCDTAKAVLELSEDELARRSGLEKETTEKILLLMRAEFAQEPEEIEEIVEEVADLRAPAADATVAPEVDTDDEADAVAEADTDAEADETAEPVAEDAAEADVEADDKPTTEGA